MVESQSNGGRDRKSIDQTEVRGDDDQLTAEIVSQNGGPDECTLFPANVADENIKTTWISAKEGSFVSLEDMR